ncbi:MAG TPA: DMT family transporter [Spirochaetia bacterium]|nr:DMT family transporter [Spirochaetia bacterium]
MEKPVPASLRSSSGKTLPHVALWGTVLFWGMSFVSSKTILNSGVPPMTMVCIRFVIATVILNVLLRWVEPEARLRRADLAPLAVSGLFGVTVYFFFESRGIKLTSASHASLIIAVIPVITVAAEALLFRTRINGPAAAGIALSVLGVAAVVYRPGTAEGVGSLLGDLFMFGACLSWVIYILLSKNLHQRLSDLAITAYQSLFGTAALIPLALLEMNHWVPLTLVAGLNLAYLAVFCSALTNFLYVYALSALGPIAVSPYINLIPVVGALGGVIVLGEQIAWTQVAGGVVIVAGVLMVSRRPAGDSDGSGASAPPPIEG